jgi:iron complex outermembrane receptor protein
LFANGPHAATRAFEIGDPQLGRERSTGLDLSLRRRSGVVTGSLTMFVNDFDDFIFETPTGTTADDLPVYQYVARDVRYAGAEIEATWHLHELGWQGFELTFSADTVRATSRSPKEPLPRIPPARFGASLDYLGRDWSAGAEVRVVTRQSRVAAAETPTDGYTLVSVYGARRIPLGSSSIEVFVRIANLGDVEARSHTSLLKELAPLPGRNITFGARWDF